MIGVLFSQPLVFLTGILAILTALSLHEFSHALAATLLGDQTAKRLGRLTLNPIAHVDVIGLIGMLTIGFGWGKPVPFNVYNLRNQRWGPVAVALAGPAMNLVVAFIFGTLLKFLLPMLGVDNLLVQFLYFAVTLNMALLLFNLIPIPPLDGSKLLLAFLHGHPAYARYSFLLETRGPMILLGLIIADRILNLNLFAGLSIIINAFIRVVVGI